VAIFGHLSSASPSRTTAMVGIDHKNQVHTRFRLVGLLKSVTLDNLEQPI